MSIKQSFCERQSSGVLLGHTPETHPRGIVSTSCRGCSQASETPARSGLDPSETECPFACPSTAMLASVPLTRTSASNAPPSRLWAARRSAPRSNAADTIGSRPFNVCSSAAGAGRCGRWWLTSGCRRRCRAKAASASRPSAMPLPASPQSRVTIWSASSWRWKPARATTPWSVGRN